MVFFPSFSFIFLLSFQVASKLTVQMMALTFLAALNYFFLSKT